ncbi:MAG: hypothetical protein NTX01_09255 [Candidatus Omnitrophica bacterium]|nr:hypothetical protein [Candidatus Omnitrophota bacterium]
MRKMFLVFSIIVFCFFLTGVYLVFAQEEAVSNIAQGETAGNVEQEETTSKQQMQAQKQELSQNAQAARAEEDQLKQQIKAAMDSGDTQTAQQLRGQLRSVHQENLRGKMQDKQEMQAAKKDNNPPGPKGGAGTNWENKPGLQGGPGASPNRKPKIGNPPGPKGGPGVSPSRRGRN